MKLISKIMIAAALVAAITVTVKADSSTPIQKVDTGKMSKKKMNKKMDKMPLGKMDKKTDKKMDKMSSGKM